MKQYNVVIIEDDKRTRDRLINAVNRHPELKVVASAENCSQGREIIHNHHPDVLLVDLGLPDGHGTEMILLAQSVSTDTEIMVITVFGDEKNVLSAIEAGATGYLLKDSDASDIGNSIMQMLSGGSPISAAIARHLLKRFKTSSPVENPAADLPKLTNREKQVLELVAKGFTYIEIASTLEISVNTVTSHIKHIYRKLSVNSRGEAVFEAVQLGLIKTLS